MKNKKGEKGLKYYLRLSRHSWWNVYVDRFPEYWEERRQKERQARLKEAKEYWEFQCRAFAGIDWERIAINFEFLHLRLKEANAFPGAEKWNPRNLFSFFFFGYCFNFSWNM